jgi:hypothetical protein
MSEDTASPPSLFVKRFGSGRKIKRRHILDLVSGAPPASPDKTSPPPSVMILRSIRS